MLGSETLVYAGNARQKVGEVTSYFRTPGMSLLDWQNNSDCGRAGRAGGHNPPPFGLGAEPANTGTSPLPVGCSHIHPKTACREVRERQWHSAAPVSAPASASAGRSPLGAAPGAAGVTKSFCPCRKTGGNTGFSPVSFLHELYGNGMHSAPGFLAWFLRFPTVLIPSSTQNAPCFAFSGFAGCASFFYPLLIREIPRIFALSLALEMIQDSVEHLNSGFRSRGGKRGKLRFFCRVAQMDHPFFPCRFWEPREYYA